MVSSQTGGAANLPHLQVTALANQKGNDEMSEVTERAAALIESQAKAAEEKSALVADLNQQIDDAKAALVALGVKRTRKPREVKKAAPVRKSKAAKETV